MKKNYSRLLAMMFVAMMSVGFAACGDDGDNEKEEPGGGVVDPVKPEEPAKDEAMSSADQKEYLEKVALEFMQLVPSSDFNKLAELGLYINDFYINAYSWDNVEDWAQDVLEDLREAIGTKKTETETESWGSYTYIYKYIYSNYKALIGASNFTGHFTAKNGSWVREDANDLQFIFNDKNGQKCVIKLETSGSEKKVNVAVIDNRTDSDYESNGNTYTSYKYYDRTNCVMKVPEKIVVTLTQGGSQVVKTTVNIDLTSIDGEEFDISKNSLNVSTQVELNNGYKVDLSKVAYTGNNNVAVSFLLSKNGTSLVTLAVTGDVRNIPSVNVSAFSSHSFDIDDYDVDQANAKNAYVKIDIIGKVQIQGTVSDVRKVFEYLEEAKDNRTNESTFKSYVNQANALTDINLFYDGKAVKQANVKIESFRDETWDGRTYWQAEPIICFFDGTSYSTLEAFFNEKDFKKTIETFNSLVNQYIDLVD